LSRIQEKLDLWKRLSREFEEVEALAEILEEEEDPELLEEFYSRAGVLKDEIESFQIKLLMDEEHDNYNAILSIHPGAGGLDSQDWAKMLLRMYLRWAERRKYDVEVAELLEDEGAGIKSVTVFIKGQFAYGYLKAERGIHRLVRISPFDAARRRHTSFVSVDVLPGRSQNRYVQSERRRRAVREHDGLGSAHNSLAYRFGGELSKRAFTAHEQASGDEDLEGTPLRTSPSGTTGRVGGDSGREKGDRLGQPDPLLCFASLYISERPSHRLGDRQCGCCSRWGNRSLYRSFPEKP